MAIKKRLAVAGALAAAGCIAAGAGMAHAVPLDAFILGGPRIITADVIGAGDYVGCGLFVHTTRTTGAVTATTFVDADSTDGRDRFRLSATATPGVKYVDVACDDGTVQTPSDFTIVKRNFPVLVF